jgi:hypothetical protein
MEPYLSSNPCDGWSGSADFIDEKIEKLLHLKE